MLRHRWPEPILPLPPSHSIPQPHQTALTGGTIEEFANAAPGQFLTIAGPSLGGAFGADGLFHLAITANTNRTYQLEVSSDLVTWTAPANCAGPGPNATLEVCDPATGQAQRYYQLK